MIKKHIKPDFLECPDLIRESDGQIRCGVYGYSYAMAIFKCDQCETHDQADRGNSINESEFIEDQKTGGNKR